MKYPGGKKCLSVVPLKPFTHALLLKKANEEGTPVNDFLGALADKWAEGQLSGARRYLTRRSWNRVSAIIGRRDDETCQYCNKPSPDGEPDHILPLNKGGRDALDNLVWSCMECNREKQGKTLREWVKIPREGSQATPARRKYTRRSEIVDWLKTLFREEDLLPVSHLMQLAHEKGYCWEHVKRAKRQLWLSGELNILSRKDGRCWSWVKFAYVEDT